MADAADLVGRLRRIIGTQFTPTETALVLEATARIESDAATIKALRETLESIFAHYRCEDGNAPGHAHSRPGIWDDDPGNQKAGLANKPYRRADQRHRQQRLPTRRPRAGRGEPARVGGAEDGGVTLDPPPCEHCFHPPTFKHREAQQEPYRGMWQALVAWEQQQNPAGVPTPLRAALHRIAADRPGAVASRTENTTRYGSEAP